MPQGIPGSPSTTEREPRFIKFWLKVRNHRCWFRQQGRPAVDSEVVAEILMNIAYTDHYRYLSHGTRGRVRVFERRGQWVFSEREYALELGWSRGRLRRFLDDYSSGDPNDKDNGPEIDLERDHVGTRLTWRKKADWPDSPTADGTTSDTTCGPPTDHPLYTRRGRRDRCTTTSDGPVDNSVDNLSMPRMVAEVVQAFHQASAPGTMKPPSVPDKLAVEKAITANGGDHIAIREYVRKATADGVAYAAKIGSDPPRTVRYGIASWNRRNERGSDPRQKQEREPESRPQHPAYHERVRPVPTRPMSDEESKKGVALVGDVLKALKLVPDTSKK